jgi:hypothetical protein
MMIHGRVRIFILSLVAFMMFACPHGPASAAAETQPTLTNAFFLTSVPTDYAKLEKYFAALKEGGANTVIIGPLAGGVPDGDALPNIIYLAHASGLRIFFVLPARGWAAALREHPEWEDMRYDLNSGTLQATGRLDLFQPEAVDYLVKLYRTIASYSIDGILLGEDFFYRDTEGMSTAALEEYKKRFTNALIPGKAIVRVGSTGSGPEVLEYGEGFREWTELKKERLIGAFQNIMSGARKVNSDVKFGIPLHGAGLASADEALSKYAYDMNAFQALNVDFYWIAIPHRDIRESRRLNYKKGMEELARIAQAATTTVKDPSQALIVIQTTTVSGKVLPFSEIEEATTMVKKGGEPCLAYMISPDRALPIALTRKLFKR